MTKDRRRFVERYITAYCARTRISRAQYEADWVMNATQVAALALLHTELAAAGNMAHVIVPAGLPGAGKLYLDISDQELEHLSILETEATEFANKPAEPL